MSSALLQQDQRSTLSGLVEVPIIANIGATGAISSTYPKTPRGYSIVRTTTGTYTITFTDKFPQIVDVSADVSLVNATPGAGNPYWATPGPYTAPTATAKATLVVYIWNPGGSALVDPANGATLFVTAVFANSAVA